VFDVNADCIVILTANGNIARYVSKYKPPVPILVGCVDLPTIMGLQFVRGVTTIKMAPFNDTTDNILKLLIKEATDRGFCKSERKVVCIHSNNEDTPDESNIMKILTVE
jgi:pyruvate kinase